MFVYLFDFQIIAEHYIIDAETLKLKADICKTKSLW